MGGFIDYVKDTIAKPSSSSEEVADEVLNDAEGNRIAKELNARYLGFTHDKKILAANIYWFDDIRFGSGYVGKNFQDALQNRNELWKRFEKPQNN